MNRREKKEYAEKFKRLLKERLTAEKRIAELDEFLTGLATHSPCFVLDVLDNGSASLQELGEIPDGIEETEGEREFRILRKLLRIALKAKDAKPCVPGR